MPIAFFDEQAEQSQVKSAIVTKYFYAWAQVINGVLKNEKDRRIAYIDLFAGPGRYKSGAKSTPLLILEAAIQDPLLSQNLVTCFNDKDPQNTESLSEAIKSLPGIERLKHQPAINTSEVGIEIVQAFEAASLVPTLIFVDPWGYKGLSLRLINSVLKDFACECIFFFNYTRINMGLSNEVVREHMNALFGAERADSLRERLEPMSPEERELTIVEEICAALIGMGGKYTLPFGFKNESGARTKHHLIFVSKHPLGYKIMKNVMAAESSSASQGVASFEYSPASKMQPLLFELSRPLDDLGDMLLAECRGRSITMGQIYEMHNVGRPYVEKNYKKVLTQLEIEGKIKGNPPYNKRQKRKGEITCADHTEFTF